MAINRGPWTALVDDDGSNLTGSIWNKAAIKDVLLDPIDVAILPVYGTWTPTDFSGASLALTVNRASYARIDKVITVWGDVTYPATANGNAAIIAGLPVIANGTAGAYVTFGPHVVIKITAGYDVLSLFDPVSSATTPNSAMSGRNLCFVGTYTIA